jgi:hypothetical protein
MKRVLRKRVVKPELEKDIQAAIVTYLKVRRVEVSVTDSSRVWGKGGGVRRSKVDPNHPDLSCVLPILFPRYDKTGNITDCVLIGLAFFIECKTKTGAIKEGQKEKLLALADSGALCVLARSLDDVKRVVEGFHMKQFDTAAYDKEIDILRLNLSDRRTKAVREELSRMGAKPDNKK